VLKYLRILFIQRKKGEHFRTATASKKHADIDKKIPNHIPLKRYDSIDRKEKGTVRKSGKEKNSKVRKKVSDWRGGKGTKIIESP